MFKNKKRYYKSVPKFRRVRSWQSSHPRRPGAGFTLSGRGLPIKKAALIFFFSASLIWFAYFFIFSANFAVKTVNITGTANIPAEDLRALAWQSLGQRPNMFLLSTKQLGAKILAKYSLDKLTIKRDWPFTINIAVSEKQARLILRALAPAEPPESGEAATSTAAGIMPSAPTYYYMDVNGIIVSAVSNSNELQSLPVMETIIPRQTLVKPGATVLAREDIAYVLAVYDAITKSSAGIKINYVSLNPPTSEEATVTTGEGWQISLSRQLPLDTQIKKLELTLREKIKDKRSSLQYVDLRVKDRVYYK